MVLISERLCSPAQGHVYARGVSLSAPLQTFEMRRTVPCGRAAPNARGNTNKSAYARAAAPQSAAVARAQPQRAMLRAAWLAPYHPFRGHNLDGDRLANASMRKSGAEPEGTTEGGKNSLYLRTRRAAGRHLAGRGRTGIQH